MIILFTTSFREIYNYFKFIRTFRDSSSSGANISDIIKKKKLDLTSKCVQLISCMAKCGLREYDIKLTVGHMGQQVPDFGGSGLLQATEQMVSLQLSRPPDSQVHVVQLFGCQVDPSRRVSFKWSMHETRQRHICKEGDSSVPN